MDNWSLYSLISCVTYFHSTFILIYIHKFYWRQQAQPSLVLGTNKHKEKSKPCWSDLHDHHRSFYSIIGLYLNGQFVYINCKKIKKSNHFQWKWHHWIMVRLYLHRRWCSFFLWNLLISTSNEISQDHKSKGFVERKGTWIHPHAFHPYCDPRLSVHTHTHTSRPTLCHCPSFFSEEGQWVTTG